MMDVTDFEGFHGAHSPTTHGVKGSNGVLSDGWERTSRQQVVVDVCIVGTGAAGPAVQWGGRHRSGTRRDSAALGPADHPESQVAG